MNTSINASPIDSFLNNYIGVLKKYNDFDGRARRSEYWSFFLVNLVIFQVLNFANLLLFNGSSLLGWLILLANLVVLVPSVAVAVRRMHDVGKSGWYVLIPFYNLILACTDSNQGNNLYGRNPKAKA